MSQSSRDWDWPTDRYKEAEIDRSPWSSFDDTDFSDSLFICPYGQLLLAGLLDCTQCSHRTAMV